jgi:glutathione peroxidase
MAGTMMRVLRLLLLLSLGGLPALSGTTVAAAERTSMTTETLPNSIYAVPLQTMQAQGGTSTTLAQYQGDVLLLVNTASHCGFTPQYQGLEALNKKYQAQGLRVLGFPCNDFGGQEPGSEQEIVKFCSTKFDVTFPLYAKLHTKGPAKAPLYRYLTESPHSAFKGDVKWNFEKFLIGRDGRIMARFPSKVKPDSPELISALEQALAAPKQAASKGAEQSAH